MDAPGQTASVEIGLTVAPSGGGFVAESESPFTLWRLRVRHRPTSAEKAQDNGAYYVCYYRGG